MKLTEQELKELIDRNIEFIHDEEYDIFYYEITKYGMEIDELIQGIETYFRDKKKQTFDLALAENISTHIFKRNMVILELTRDKMINYLNYLKIKNIDLEENKNV